MVEAKNKKLQSNYVHGSVAYDLEPEINPIIKKSNKKAKLSPDKKKDHWIAGESRSTVLTET